MADDTAIKVNSVSKSFKLPHEKQNTIKSALINFRRAKRGYEKQQVLNDISFEIKKGEFFGIVGRNGSGKSTLLKLLAGIYTPDKGSVHINGKLTPFIELGVGFNPELSGRENVFLNGALLGFNRKEMQAMYNEIVAFAELERFMDQKLKNYSSGMQVRLAFSIAVRANTDILVLDEVLAVGDEAFQRKCFEYFAELKKQKKTVILVTHSMDSVQQFCTRAMLLQDGKIMSIGNTAKIATQYRQLNNPEHVAVKQKDSSTQATKNAKISADFKKDTQNNRFNFTITVTPEEDMPDTVIAISMTSNTGEIVYRWASNEKISKHIQLQKGKKITIRMNVQNIFPNGTFSLNVSLRNEDMTTFYISANELLSFEVVNQSSFAADRYWKPIEQVEIE